MKIRLRLDSKGWWWLWRPATKGKHLAHPFRAGPWPTPEQAFERAKHWILHYGR